MNTRILRALLRKEISLLKRNPIIPKMIFVMPVMVMLVLPLVATLDVRNINIAVVDNDRSQLSRRIVADLAATDRLTVEGIYGSHHEAIGAIERGRADVALTIPPHWARDMSLIDVETNGVNATKGMLGARYVSASVAATLAQSARQQGSEAAHRSAATTVAYRYNPTLDFRNFMIPGLMVILLIIICGFLPALSLVSEKESGTIEAMNVSPVGRLTLVMSKLIPYWIVGMLIITVGMLIGWAVYGLRPLGSVGAIYLAAALMTLTMSATGVAVAARSSTMLQSVLAMFALIVAFQLMGGLFTPISSMPRWAQAITYAIPPRYFNEIIRAIYLKGATVADLWTSYLPLAGLAAATCLLAALTYSKRS